MINELSINNSEQVRYVFANAVRTFGVTGADLQKDAAKANLHDLRSVEQMYDGKLQYVLNPLRRVKMIGSDSDSAMFLIDLTNQQIPGFEAESKAIEIFGESGMPGTIHLLMPYSQTTLSMLSTFGDYGDDKWQLAFQNEMANAPKTSVVDGHDIELPDLDGTESIDQIVID